jgi:hypothetical protein
LPIGCSRRARLIMSSPHLRLLPLPEITSENSVRRGRKIVSRSVSVVTIHIPLRYNANIRGMRKPVEQSKIGKSLREAQSYFSGFSILRTSGWCRGHEASGTWDDHIRIEIDICPTEEHIRLLAQWRRTLETRFKQDSIYLRIMGNAQWL